MGRVEHDVRADWHVCYCVSLWLQPLTVKEPWRRKKRQRKKKRGKDERTLSFHLKGWKMQKSLWQGEITHNFEDKRLVFLVVGFFWAPFNYYSWSGGFIYVTENQWLCGWSLSDWILDNWILVVAVGGWGSLGGEVLGQKSEEEGND